MTSVRSRHRSYATIEEAEQLLENWRPIAPSDQCLPVMDLWLDGHRLNALSFEHAEPARTDDQTARQREEIATA